MIQVARPAPVVEAFDHDPTDEEMTVYTDRLITDFKHRLGMDEWHTEWAWDPTLGVLAHTNYSWDKREAYLQFRTEMARRDHARLLPYAVAHELAHLVVSEMDVMRDRILIGQNARMTTVVLEHWKYVEETAVHRIALALAGVEKPSARFWWEPFNDGNDE